MRAQKVIQLVSSLLTLANLGLLGLWASKPVDEPMQSAWVYHNGQCTLTDIATSTGYAQLYEYDMEPAGCWTRYCHSSSCDNHQFYGCHIRLGMNIVLFSSDASCLFAKFNATPAFDSATLVDLSDYEDTKLATESPEYEVARRETAEVAQLGGSDMRVHRQYAKGRVSRDDVGSKITYSVTSYSGDGNAGKNKRAVRTEDSWQQAIDVRRFVFSMKNSRKSTGNQILINFQVKKWPNDKNPVVAIGQKSGQWAIKFADRASEALNIPATRPISVSFAKNKNGKHDVLINDKRVVVLKLTRSSIFKTGVYSSDWRKSIDAGDEMTMEFNSIACVTSN